MAWPNSSPKRLSIVEYGPGKRIGDEANRAGITADTLRRQLEQSGDRLSAILGVSNPFIIQRDEFRVGGIAGLVRLSSGLELEVCPKFLNPTDPNWREDFFLIATLTRYGRVLPKESIQSETKEKYSLADLIALTVLEMYEVNKRRPLRIYKNRTWKSFEIDGELEAESVVIRNDSGYTQHGVILDRKNQYNQVIYHAVSLLLPEVRDGDIRRRLSEVRLRLSPQDGRTRSGLTLKRLPSRHSRWQDLYDLSGEILRGFGIGYRDRNQLLAPGFVLRTANAWEQLLLMAVRSVMTDRVVLKAGHALGARTRVCEGKAAPIRVTPDMTVSRFEGFSVPVDAKYKGRISDNGVEQIGISNADVYEALAFMEAINATRCVLLYPKPGTETTGRVGTCEVFESVEVQKRRVFGATVETRGISSPGGLKTFSVGIANALRESGA